MKNSMFSSEYAKHPERRGHTIFISEWIIIYL